jgi:hypothetical protein
MKKNRRYWLRHSIAVVAATLLAACSTDLPVAPAEPLVLPAPHSPSLSRAPELGGCQKLQAPAGSKLAYHVYASGVQIYQWNGAAWSLLGPSATLSADPEGNSTVGTHYAGPTWESNSGSKVVGAVVDRCTASPNAVPWLLLRAVSSEGPGVLRGVTSIQRVNTVGGNPPSTPGLVIGEEARVQYAAEYFFYRAS